MKCFQIIYINLFKNYENKNLFREICSDSEDNNYVNKSNILSPILMIL